MMLPLPTPDELVELNEENPISKYVREWIAAYLGVERISSENILFTNGADAAIHALARSLLRDKAVDCFDLNYGYADRMLAKGSSVRKHPTAWQTSDGTRSYTGPALNAESMYVTSSDNRLGLDFTHIPASANPANIRIIDESYADYHVQSSSDEQVLSPTLRIRSFSKFFGLEPSRVAYLFGEAQLIASVRESIPQFPIATGSVINLLHTLDRSTPEAIANARERVRVWKFALYARLESLGVPHARSQTDFVTLFNTNPCDIPELGDAIGELKVFQIGTDTCYRVRMDRAQARIGL